MTKFINDVLLQEFRQYVVDIVSTFLDPVKRSLAATNTRIDKMMKWYDIQDDRYTELEKGIKESQLYLEKELEKLKKKVK